MTAAGVFMIFLMAYGAFPLRQKITMLVSRNQVMFSGDIKAADDTSRNAIRGFKSGIVVHGGE